MTNEEIKLQLDKFEIRIAEMTTTIQDVETQMLLEDSLELPAGQIEIIVYHIKTKKELIPLSFWITETKFAKTAFNNLYHKEMKRKDLQYLIAHFRTGICVGITPADAEDTIQFASSLPLAAWTKKIHQSLKRSTDRSNL